MSSFNSEYVSSDENLSLFTRKTTAEGAVQQGLFSQVIKENIEDNDFSYTVIKSENASKIVSELSSAKRISIRFSANNDEIDSISV